MTDERIDHTDVPSTHKTEKNTDLMMGRVTPAASRDPSSGPMAVFPFDAPQKSPIEWAPAQGKDLDIGKPPIGVIPRWLFEEKVRADRLQMLADAMIRYHESNRPIPQEWSEEVAHLKRDPSEKIPRTDIEKAVKGVVHTDWRPGPMDDTHKK